MYEGKSTGFRCLAVLILLFVASCESGNDKAPGTQATGTDGGIQAPTGDNRAPAGYDQTQGATGYDGRTNYDLLQGPTGTAGRSTQPEFDQAQGSTGYAISRRSTDYDRAQGPTGRAGQSYSSSIDRAQGATRNNDSAGGFDGIQGPTGSDSGKRGTISIERVQSPTGSSG